MEYASLSDFKRIAWNYYQFEPAFELLVSKSRRTNTYCKSNGKVFDYIEDQKVQEKIDGCCTVSELIKLMNPPTSQTKWQPDRYYKLNFSAYDKHRSIEFRLHQGTSDPTKSFYYR
eukprot:UN06681